MLSDEEELTVPLETATVDEELIGELESAADDELAAAEPKYELSVLVEKTFADVFSFEAQPESSSAATHTNAINFRLILNISYKSIYISLYIKTDKKSSKKSGKKIPVKKAITETVFVPLMLYRSPIFGNGSFFTSRLPLVSTIFVEFANTYFIKFS